MPRRICKKCKQGKIGKTTFRKKQKKVEKREKLLGVASNMIVCCAASMTPFESRQTHVMTGVIKHRRVGYKQERVDSLKCFEKKLMENKRVLLKHERFVMLRYYDGAVPFGHDCMKVVQKYIVQAPDRTFNVILYVLAIVCFRRTMCAGCNDDFRYKKRELKRCGGCRKVSYCSRKCQKMDYKVHKEICRGKMPADSHAS